MDDRLIEHGINAGLSYAFAGRRLHGSAISPAIRHIGNKMAKVGAAGRVAYAAYKYGKRKLIQSFSQNEKQMPPVRRKLSFATPTPRSGGKGSVKKSSVRKALFSARRRNYQRVMRNRKVVHHSGKMAGGVKRGSRRTPVKAKYEKQGVGYTWEYTGTDNNSTSQTTIVGHSTSPAYNLLFIALGAICKMLLKKMQIALTAWEDLLGVYNFNVGDTFTLIYYRNTADAVPIAATFTLAAGMTYENLINNLRVTVIQSVNALDRLDNGLRFVSIIYEPATVVGGLIRKQRCEVNLIGARIDLYGKSDMKIQNRSVSVDTDNQADNVNNVPIFGKTYEGAGTGFEVSTARGATITQVAGQTKTVCVNNNSGLIVIGGHTVLLYEPVQRKELRGVSSQGKIGIQPGEIKTSSLTFKRSVKLDYLMSEVLQFVTSALAIADAPRLKIGKFRMMILEKVLGLAGSTGVKIAYEHNFYLGAIFKYGAYPATRQGFSALN